MRCAECVRLAQELGSKTPVGWTAFGWGPSDEDPNHFHVMVESENTTDVWGPEQVDVTRLCDVENPVKRA